MPLNILKKWFSRDDAGWVAVGIAQGGVSLAQVDHPGGNPRVVQCVHVPMTKVTAAEIGRVLREHQVTRQRVTTLLSASEYQMMPIPAPNVPADELKSAIRWQVKDSLHFDIEAVTLDAIRIPTQRNREGGEQSYYAVAAPNEAILRRTTLLEDAGARLQAIDIPEMAQRNLANLYPQQDEALMLLMADNRGSTLTFTFGGELYLTRRFDISAFNLDEGNPMERLHYWESLGRQLQLSVDYFERQSDIKVGRLVMATRSELHEQSLLESALSIPVQRLRLSEVMDVSGAPRLADPEYAQGMLPLIGAALRQERRAL